MIRHQPPPLLRIAQRIRDAYEQRHEHIARPAPPCLTSMAGATMEQIARCERMFEKARGRGFDSAIARLRPRYSRLLSSLLQQVDSVQSSLLPTAVIIPDLGLLHDELEAATEEFGAVAFDANGRQVSVTTEPIALEGIGLGEFRIVLYLDDLPQGDLAETYGVEAIDPNPASSSDDVCHPHVLGTRLCAGDALAAVRQSLRTGRLCEFFIIVRSVLNTYNRESAYVELDEWDGISCSDCGRTVGHDDILFCEACQEDCCCECSCICPTCRLNYCKNCLLKSHASERWVCTECAGQCERCEEPFVDDELDDGLCSSCAQVEAAFADPQLNPLQPKEFPHDDHLNHPQVPQTQGEQGNHAAADRQTAPLAPTG